MEAGRSPRATQVNRTALDWLSHPPSTGAKQLTVFEATLAPGKGHSYHKHPDQEEVLYVVSGEIEQWIDQEQRFLGPGCKRYDQGLARQA